MRLMRTIEVANFFDVTPATVANWCKRSILPHIRIGRNYQFRADAIRRLMREREVRANTDTSDDDDMDTK